LPSRLHCNYRFKVLVLLCFNYSRLNNSALYCVQTSILLDTFLTGSKINLHVFWQQYTSKWKCTDVSQSYIKSSLPLAWIRLFIE
jgi:hypothetical protein